MAGITRGAALAGRASQVRLSWEGWGVLGQSMQGCIPCQPTMQAVGLHNSGWSLWPSLPSPVQPRRR